MLYIAGQNASALSVKLGINLSDARKIVGAVIGRGESLRQARNVRREVLDLVEAATKAGQLKKLGAVDASDGFRKYLFELADGARIETVRIPLFDTHYTLCLSSQAGCALACIFCATGRLGLNRSLQSWEIVDQFLQVRADSSRPITGAVFMGMGEPFHNYDNVIAAAYALCDPSGARVDARRISISTAGVVPMIKRYTAEGHPFRLCVSLTAALPSKRLSLMPIEKGFPLNELIEVVSDHAARRGRVTLEYVMISGVNVGNEDAIALGKLLKGLRVRLNPIAVNDTSGNFPPPGELEWKAFRDALAREMPGIPITRRYSGGQDQNAGCGMLAGSISGIAPLGSDLSVR